MLPADAPHRVAEAAKSAAALRVFRLLSAVGGHSGRVSEPSGWPAPSRPAATDEPVADPAVEGNARLTATTGVVLLVLLAAEGLTIVSIRPLLSWHVALGMALIPPVALKTGSTVWRFAHYYLGDRRYVRAGPPHPILRVIGPLVVVLTAAVLVTGIWAWAAGPHHHNLVTWHKVTFFLWFGVMTVHVLGHIWRAVRLARADLAPQSRREVPQAATRQGAVLASLIAGIVLAVATRGLAGGWASFVHDRFH
jgi:hypothetical protein